MKTINDIVELEGISGPKIFTMQEALEKFHKEHGTELQESVLQLKQAIIDMDRDTIENSAIKLKSRYKSYQSLKWLAFPEKYASMIQDETTKKITILDEWLNNKVFPCIDNQENIDMIVEDINKHINNI